ncbi:RteC protein [Cruoricaptor ignavus]|uniref:RteC protein n=2 Tax=Cruoricaptor ignavus TaxID=1118202 RepID=A0A1M5ZX21_9FLAO|nr:RteC protein [Cruoricaptor ignavus]
MFEKILQIYSEMETHLNFLELEEEAPFPKSKRAIPIIQNALDKVRPIFLKAKPTPAQEIKFFKEIKPKFTSKLFYHNGIYRMETDKPSGSTEILIDYFRSQQQDINRYFNKHRDFIKYYRTDQTYLDHKYFIRGAMKFDLEVDNISFAADPAFFTDRSFKIGKIRAHEILEIYLSHRIAQLETPSQHIENSQHRKYPLTWTLSKTDIIELIYSLQSVGAFNNGTADLKDIADAFADYFDVNLSQPSRTFIDIRRRKSNPTKFISELQEKLQQRIDEAEEDS